MPGFFPLGEQAPWGQYQNTYYYNTYVGGGGTGGGGGGGTGGTGYVQGAVAAGAVG